MVIEKRSNLQLTGETVEVNYVADPSLGHGQFRLENRGDRSVSAAIESAWLQFGEQRRLLEGITVYDLGQELEVDPQNLKVEANAALRFLVAFPAVVHEPSFGEPTAVGVRMRVDGAEVEAHSPIKFIRRIPRR